MARTMAPKHVTAMRETEDGEIAAVAAAAAVVGAARARRSARLAALDATVTQAEQAETNAIAHMVAAVGVDQTARLLGTGATALRRRLPPKAGRHADRIAAGEPAAPGGAA